MDRWGGHLEDGESPEECLLREVKEETGLTLTSWRFRGLVTFTSQGWGTEYMCLYTADRYEGEPTACSEGTLEWVPKEKVLDLNLWEGDKIFFRLIEEEAPFFSLKLSYQGDRLSEAVLDGRPLELFDVRDIPPEQCGREPWFNGTATFTEPPTSGWCGPTAREDMTYYSRNGAQGRTPIPAAMIYPLPATSMQGRDLRRRLCGSSLRS